VTRLHLQAWRACRPSQRFPDRRRVSSELLFSRDCRVSISWHRKLRRREQVYVHGGNGKSDDNRRRIRIELATSTAGRCSRLRHFSGSGSRCLLTAGEPRWGVGLYLMSCATAANEVMVNTALGFGRATLTVRRFAELADGIRAHALTAVLPTSQSAGTLLGAFNTYVADSFTDHKRILLATGGPVAHRRGSQRT